MEVLVQGNHLLADVVVEAYKGGNDQDNVVNAAEEDDEAPEGAPAEDAFDDVDDIADEVEVVDEGINTEAAWPTDDDDNTVEDGDGTEFEDTTADGGSAETDKARAVTEVADNGGEPFVFPRYHLREQRRRVYSHRLDHQMDVTMSARSYEAEHQMLQAGKCVAPTKENTQYNFGHIMTQMTATARIKKHGQKAIDALLKEFCQLDDKSVFAPFKRRHFCRHKRLLR
jgi:hypothetical protein